MFVDDAAYTNDSNDPYGLDIAAFRLLPESSTKLKAAGKCFVDQRYLHDDDGLGVCLFFGYPYSLCEDGLAPQGLCLLGPRDDGNTASWRKKLHVLMESNPMITNLATEEKVEIPDLEGISGCGVWRVCDVDTSDNPLNLLRFIGIEHRVGAKLKHVNGYIKSTQIQHLHRLLLWRYPELKPAMSLLFWKARPL